MRLRKHDLSNGMKPLTLGGMKPSFLCGLAVCIALVSFTAAAAEKETSSPSAPAIPVLQKIKEQGDGAEKGGALEFDHVGKEFGADMWLVSGDKVMQTIYVLPSGAAIVGGVLVSPDGKEISPGMHQEFARKNKARVDTIVNRVKTSIETAAKKEKTTPDAAKTNPPITSETVWERMSSLGIVHFGADKEVPVIYLVIDPTQDVSQQAFAKLDGFAAEKKIDLRVVPISLHSPEAILRLAVLLGEAAPQESLRSLMTEKNIEESKMSEKGPPPNPQGAMKLKNNADFVDALKINTLPSLFYRRSSADPVRAVKGEPKNWSIIFNELGLQ